MNTTRSSTARPLKCPAPGCSRSFRYPSDLERHWKLHTQEKDFMCETCGEGFMTSKALQKHNFYVHRIGDPVYCDQCFKPFYCEEAVKAHVKSAHEGRGTKSKRKRAVTHGVCNEELPEKEELKPYMFQHDEPGEEGGRTESLHEDITSSASHSYGEDMNVDDGSEDGKEQIMHTSDNKALLQSQQTPQMPNPGTNAVLMNMPSHGVGLNMPLNPHMPHMSAYSTMLQQFQGAYENTVMNWQHQQEQMLPDQLQPLRTYKTVESLPIRDYDTHSNEGDTHSQLLVETPASTKKSFSKRRKSVISVNLAGEHVCDVCNKRFKYRSGLSRHYQTHQGYTKYICSMCHKGFPDAWHLNDHVKIVHENIRDFKCSMCLKSYTRKSQLQSHVNIIHLNKRFQCDVCFKTFPSQVQLENHIMNQACRFGQKKVNKSTPEEQPPLEKPHLCKWCGQNFRTYEEADQHINESHSDKLKANDKGGPQIKTGLIKEKKFECPICGKRFMHYSNMWTHKASTHRFNTKKPFACGYCRKVFTRGDRVQRHVYAKHPDEIQKVVEFLSKHKETVHSGVQEVECAVVVQEDVSEAAVVTCVS